MCCLLYFCNSFLDTSVTSLSCALQRLSSPVHFLKLSSHVPRPMPFFLSSRVLFSILACVLLSPASSVLFCAFLNLSLPVLVLLLPLPLTLFSAHLSNFPPCSFLIVMPYRAVCPSLQVRTGMPLPLLQLRFGEAVQT